VKVTGAISFRELKPETLADVIDAVNSLGINVEASINDDGNGISLVDTSGGSESLTVANVGNSVTADELGLTGDSVTQTISGQDVEVLTSSAVYTIDISATDSLDDIVQRINDLTSRTAVLQSRIELNTRRIDELNIRLDSQRERLLIQFYRMETAIGRMQTSLASIQSIQRIPAVTSSSR
jgi:flagellar capping protein FliD